MAGGEVARYMSRHGGKGVAKAVLISCVTPFMLQTDDHDGAPASLFDGMVAGLKKDRAKFLADFWKGFFGIGMLASPVSDEVLQWTLNLAMLASPKATTDCVEAFGKTDFRQDMPHFKVPTLIIHGDADQTVPIDFTGKASAAAIQGSTFKIYEGAPHSIPHARRRIV